MVNTIPSAPPSFSPIGYDETPVRPIKFAPTGATPQTQPTTRRSLREANKKRNRSGRLHVFLAALLMLGGLSMAAYWAWSTFGTTFMLRGQMEEDLTAFTEQLPEAPEEVVEYNALHTDFEAFPPPHIDLDQFAIGDAFGVLTVPTWHGQTGVVDESLRNRILVKQGSFDEATTQAVLDTGAAAHYSTTAGPGEIGNFSISAHRRSYGDNFLLLPELREGDWVLLETTDYWFIYRVIDYEMVLPTDIRVINPDPFSEVDDEGYQFPTRRLMTMTTCTTANGGPWGNSHRWVTWAELYGWMSRSEGIPPMIDSYWDDSESPIQQAAAQ